MVLKKPFLVLFLMLSTALAVAADKGEADRRASRNLSESANPIKAKIMKIRITIGDKTIHGTLADNATARDFAALLPLTVTLEDYAGTEKIHSLPKKLSTAGTPAGIDPSVGDITYYAPWGNLAIFYRDFGYSTGLVELGIIDSGVEQLAVPWSLNATIEKLPD